MVAVWRELAEKRDDAEAVNNLLSRPFPSDDLAPYWSAFLYLSRDRPRESISLGVNGGLSLALSIPVERIRAEGERLGYSNDALEDFEAILVRIDDAFVEVTVKKRAADVNAAAQKAQRERRR